MIRHAAIAALVALSAMALVSCSSKSNKSASTVQSPTPAKQQLSHSSTAQASGVDIAAMSHLYLLAATPAQDYGYPATLYRVVEDKLKSVRELVPQTEGVRFVQSWGNVIFLVDLPGEDVTVVHNDDPLQVDKVATHLGFVNPYELLLAMPNDSAVDELLAIGQPDLGKVSLSEHLQRSCCLAEAAAQRLERIRRAAVRWSIRAASMSLTPNLSSPKFRTTISSSATPSLTRRSRLIPWLLPSATPQTRRLCADWSLLRPINGTCF